jgi:hypothetical protein
MNPFEYVTERQYSWARRHGITIDEAGYTEQLNDNLFLPMTPEVIEEFPRGREGHLGDSIYAAHSSAALVVNVFYYWRLYRRLKPIMTSLGLNVVNCEVHRIRFEAPCPITWTVQPNQRRNPPQLDVIIEYEDSADHGVTKAIAIESKFREPYGSHDEEFAECYLASENAPLWSGIEPLQDLAMRIQRGERISRRLKVDQLIKHILGLKSIYPGHRHFELLYLWYPAPGSEAVQHEEEIKLFEQSTKACDFPIKFRAIMYPDLIQQLATRYGDTDGAYVDYLLERYF